MNRRLLLVFFVGALAGLLSGFIVDDVRAAAPAGMLPPSGPFPDAECNEDAVHDIYIDHDGVLWECVCQTMVFGPPDCVWYEVPPMQALRLRKALRVRMHVRLLPRLVVIPR